MRIRRRLAPIIALVVPLAVACSEKPTGLLESDGTDGPSAAADHTPDKMDHVPGGTVSASNGVYSVFVEDIPGFGVGLYTAATGANHPVTMETGSAQNVFFAGAAGDPGTTYTTIRSYSSGTDYVQRTGSPASSFAVVNLDPWINPAITATVDPIGTTGWRTTYVLPGPPETPDALTIEQDVNIMGTAYSNSSIEVTTRITNDGSSNASLGVRYLWDYQIGQDDGPTFSPRSPDGGPVVTEAAYGDPTFSYYRIQDNDGNATSPLFAVFGSVNGPGGVSPAPTVPDLLQHASWEGAFARAFDYTADPGLDVSTTASGVNDDAVAYYFGADASSALVVAPGESVAVSQSTFAAAPATPVPFVGGALEVEIDITPGGARNPVSLRSRGRLPVAVLTADGFDASEVDPATVTLGDDDGDDTPVAERRNGRLFASLEDVDRDGDEDLVLHFERPALVANGDLDGTTTELVLNGATADGTVFRGTDSVRPVGR